MYRTEIPKENSKFKKIMLFVHGCNLSIKQYLIKLQV